MDDFGNEVSPRKKLKVHHPSLDGNMEQSADILNEAPTGAASIEDGNPAPGLDKDGQCGITEFVDLDKPGFSGVLKKRLVH